MNRAVPVAVLAGVAIGTIILGEAQGSSRPAPRQTQVVVSHRYVLGHKVWECSWNGYTANAAGRVVWQFHPRTLVDRVRNDRNAVCAVNGNTYVSSNLLPAGPVRAGGRWVTKRYPSQPVFGFVGRRVVFGWDNVRRFAARNIMSGKAYLVRNGHAIRRISQAPFATHAQFWCGGRGTDSWYGCFRSAVVQFRNGRYGLVSIALASMPKAGKILVRMGVVNAVTGDSGGGEEGWFEGHSFGTIPNHGPHANWKRRIPDAIIVDAGGCNR